MNINKYYTPVLEEFHIGFRFETKLMEDSWFPIITNYKSFIEWGKSNTLYKSIQNNNIRVKYLDQQDIEELGWKINSDGYYFKPKGIGEQYFLERIKKDIWRITCENHTGEKEEVEQLFLGKIKNYNELKQVMKFLNIIE